MSIQQLKVLVLFWLLLPISVFAQVEITTYYHNDHLGSPLVTSNDNGDLVNEYGFASFGGEGLIGGPAKGRGSMNYTGHTKDDELGLVYMHARYYDAEIGRFYSNDPVGFVESSPLSFNRYAYANNSPYAYVDPDGEFANFIIGGVVAALQDVAIQTVLIATGVQDEFSFGSLTASTALGVATSGGSTLAKLGVTSGKILRHGDEVVDVTKGAGDSTTLYRAVSKAELDDIAANGVRTTSGGYETGKLFATSLEDATKFGMNNFKLDGIPNHLVKVDVPNSVMKDATKFRADFMDAVSVPANQLNQLNATPINYSPLVK